MAHARIFLVRHGRTAWNIARRRQGREDIPLSEEGRGDAEAVCAALADEAVHKIYSSPLSRARETIAPLAKRLSVPIQPDDDLLELDFGVFSGTSRDDVKVHLRKDYLHAPIPGGESLADVWTRARRFADRIRPELAAGQTLIIIGHQRLNRLLLGVLKSQSLEDAAKDNSYRPEPGSITEIKLEQVHDKLKILAITGVGDAAHPR